VQRFVRRCKERQGKRVNGGETVALVVLTVLYFIRVTEREREIRMSELERERDTHKTTQQREREREQKNGRERMEER